LDGKQAVANVYPHQIAFNALPHIDVFLENGYTKEEMKMVNETHKMLDPNILVSPTAVRIPVFRGHSESINLEFEKPFEMEQVFEIYKKAPGIQLVDDPARLAYPLAIDAEDCYEVFVGRLRRDPSVENGLNMWVVSDNLLKGAALNTVQIAEKLVEMDLVDRSAHLRRRST
jgi:aspartate-semialdehyde dehydrogenase